jgi:hypothetical protein
MIVTLAPSLVEKNFTSNGIVANVAVWNIALDEGHFNILKNTSSTL